MLRPVAPSANFDTQPFWDGCARGELLLQRCAACGTWRHPPSPVCPNCLGDQAAWMTATGQGTVYSFVVVRETRARGWDKMVPYVVAVIALDEGPRMLSNLIDIAPEQVAVDMPVEVTFADVEGGATRLPLFRPRATEAVR